MGFKGFLAVTRTTRLGRVFLAENKEKREEVGTLEETQ